MLKETLNITARAYDKLGGIIGHLLTGIPLEEINQHNKDHELKPLIRSTPPRSNDVDVIKEKRRKS